MDKESLEAANNISLDAKPEEVKTENKIPKKAKKISDEEGEKLLGKVPESKMPTTHSFMQFVGMTKAVPK